MNKPPMMEVRCCCDATRVLGWLPAPSCPRMAFLLTRPENWDWSKGPFNGTVELEVGVVYERDEYGWEYIVGRAYKNPDLPIETLRRIPSFKENKR